MTETHSGAMNMALDEACLFSIAQGESPATIRFYRWNPGCVSLGYFQNRAREVDDNRCHTFGVDIVRRQTGGGAVYHDPEGEITYSVLAPERFFPADIIASYREICGWIIQALAVLGVKAEFAPINDILVGGQKISGNAQTRRQGVLLQHGTLLYGVDIAKMFSLLKVPDEKIRDKMIATVSERVTSLRQKNPALGINDLEKALFTAFTAGKNYEIGYWSAEEKTLAAKLAQSKYAAVEWTDNRRA